MTLKLPSHVQGWKIPTPEQDPPLTVVYASSWLGPQYEAGDLNAGWTKLVPKTAHAWVVESDTHSGLAVMEFKTDRHADAYTARRATAAMLYFCIHADGPDGTGYLPTGGVIHLPEHIVRDTARWDLGYLHDAGFVETAWTGDLIGDPDRIFAYTTNQYPELAEAELLASRTEEEEIALAAASRGAEQVVAEQ